MLTTVMSAWTWPSNAALIADVHRLYPLDEVRDVTYGRGLWWTKHHPKQLLASDIRGLGMEVPGAGYSGFATPVDFRDLPDDDDLWPVVAFDPPYLPQTKAQQATSTLTSNTGGPSFGERYGLDNAAGDHHKLRKLIDYGLQECARITAPGGIILVKCMNYVYSGEHRPQAAWAVADGEAMGLSVAAQFIHIKGAGPQPTANPNGHPRAVKSPRANYSTLIVFRKPKRGKTC